MATVKSSSSITSNTSLVTISQISKLESFTTSEVFIYGIPWKVKVCKIEYDEEEEEKPSLGVDLIFVKEDKSLKWSIPAAVLCKLLQFGDNLNAHEKYFGPYAFNRTITNGRGDTLIPWNDLFDDDNKYVKDDTIKLEIKIDVGNPNDPKRSGVQFKCVEKSCDDGCMATFRLTVTNVSNLMAVQTPPYKLRGLFWCISVGKDVTSNLFAQLDFDEPSEGISCKVVWSIKLLSTKSGVDPIEQKESVLLQSYERSCMDNIASWNELFKPENGFVNKDSITLEVEIKMSKPERDMPIAKRAKLSPKNEAECPICSKSIDRQDLAITPCGHLFCLACITGHDVCGTCNKAIQVGALRRFIFQCK